MKIKPFKLALIFIIAANILSYLGYLSYTLNAVVFVLILAVTLISSFKKLEYGLYVVLAELFIGSFGYLFYLDLGKFHLSLRMGLFLVVILVWLLKSVRHFCRAKVSDTFLIFWRSKTRNWYLALAVVVIFGIINGLWQGNAKSNILADSNAYFYFALVPVFFASIRSKHQIKNIFSILMAALLWQFILIIFFFFLYTHLDIFWQFIRDAEFYRWARDLRLIEIGQFKYNFYRVFMQSSVWAVFGFFVVISQGTWLKFREISTRFRLALLTCIFTILIISLSRAFWIGTVISFLIFLALLIFKFKIKFKQFLKLSLNLIIPLCLSLFIIAIILLAPIGQISVFKSLSALKDRATEKEEPAIISRWQLLKPLSQAVFKEPILGQGFGATVTYKTEDPRFLSSHPDGMYTAFAFEWGYLDIVYKIGLIGFMMYGGLIVVILRRRHKVVKLYSPACQKGRAKALLLYGCQLGFFAMLVIHFFSPYLNHPLGIGMVMLTDVLGMVDKGDE